MLRVCRPDHRSRDSIAQDSNPSTTRREGLPGCPDRWATLVGLLIERVPR